ncbi:hypothetical protein Cfor_02420 [Coptotermes formosanus]|uniref:Protein Wnt n=1 Tax=Coptotermes formosanus TaxID=36987 RepID=A0A6L2PLR6_COPFO|nr:hypothetical protein Cfor_02420 [Coptotermes formosanus]
MFETSSRSSPCTASRQNKRLCRNKSVRDILQKARFHATTECQEQFRYDRWNCSAEHKNISFFDGSKVYRETALLYAMSAAALTHVIARECAEGSRRLCRCAGHPSPEDTVRNWRWGISDDNYSFGRRFTRRFAQLRYRRVDHLHGYLVRHNMVVGIQAVGQMQTVCKCHGVSGSCTTKTCWKRLKPFKETVEILKGSYHKAQLKVYKNRASRQGSSKGQMSRNTLVYTDSSPDFCPTTRGRRCLDSDNCGVLCCSRGYISRSVEETEHCDCHWVSKHYKLSCRRCTFMKEIYACK